MTYRRIALVGALLLLGAGTATAQRGKGREKKEKPTASEMVKSEAERNEEAKRREAAYQLRLDAQLRAARNHATRLERDKRTAQYAQHQRYLHDLEEQQRRLKAGESHSHDDGIWAAPTYRYRRAGVYHQINQYGADVLRDAVNVGYQQGVEAGRADRQDRARSNYQRSFAYQDANYGYNGRYVPEADYNYYFREGFRRGYEDGYGNQWKYGSESSGSTPLILAGIAAAILGFVALH